MCHSALVSPLGCRHRDQQTYLQGDIEIRLNGVERLKNRKHLLNGWVIVLAEVAFQDVDNRLKKKNN